MRTRNTIEFLGVWEEIYNPNFNYTEFGVIMSEAGVNRFNNVFFKKGNWKLID